LISKKLQTIQANDKEFLFQNYGDRLPVSFVKGDGSLLYDHDGKEYIDFLSGIAVSNLGYNHKGLQKVIHKQIDSLIHTSNWFLNNEQIKAAQLLSETAFKGKSLFCNSGAEANEAAIKLARRHGLSISSNKYRIISFTSSFHGRTLGTMTATAQEKIHGGFGPLPEGFTYLPFNDLSALKAEMKKGDTVAAVIVEIIQGESGIQLADSGFLKEIQRECKKNNALFIIDEVQTGIGRTGKFFAFEHYSLKPDVITLAKGLAGGLPIGAIHVRPHIANHFPPGSHGTTFGGNHLTSAAAAFVLNEIKKPAFLKKVNDTGNIVIEELQSWKKDIPIIKEIRGKGLHIGIELTIEGMPLVKKGLERGLILNCAAGNTIRIMPPLNIPKSLMKKGLSILKDLLLEEI